MNPIAEHYASKGADEEAGEDYGAGDARGSYVSSLKDILGLDDDQAEELAHAICGLAREEMMEKGPEEEAGPKKKGGLALLIGVGKPKK